MQSKRIAAGVLFGSLISFFSCATAWAQATAQITGTVKDQSGAVLPGAEVTVVQTDTGVARSSISNDAGVYILPSLAVGPYRLEVSLPGFRTSVQTGIVLQVNSNPVINAVLEIGGVSEQVQVEANAAMVETQSTGVGQVVDQQRVVDLPLNGRNPAQLIFLAGAATQALTGDLVTAGKNYPGTVVIAVAGGQPNGTTYLLDGSSHNDVLNGLTLPLPFPDALQEFKVETSALPAQYGQHSAAAVNAVTKSGTNEFHGDAFEFVRNGSFNARNFFAPVRDALKRNQFGGTLGGPIMKNKLFFFAGYQSTIQRSNPMTGITYVPTPEMLQGDFTTFASSTCNQGRQITLKAPFVNNRIPVAQISQPGLNLVKMFPLAENSCGVVHYPEMNNMNEQQGVMKVDYHINDKHSIFVRYFATHLIIPLPDALANPLLAGTQGQDVQVQSGSLSETYLISPNTISSFHLTGNRSGDQKLAANFVTFPELGVDMWVPPGLPKLVAVNVTGGYNVAPTTNRPSTTSYQLAEDLSFIRGSHQIAAGVNYIHGMLTRKTSRNSNGVFTFNGSITGLGYGDLFAGTASGFLQGMPSRLFNPIQKYMGLYVQDAWKLTPRLTVNYGIRWEPFFTIAETHGDLSLFQLDWFKQGVHSTVFPNAPAGTLFPGDRLPGGGTLNKGAQNTQWWDFAPRFGLVWDPKGNGRMTVRAAFGKFYDIPNIFWNNNISFEPPFGSSVSTTNVNFAKPWATFPGGNPFPVVFSHDTTFPSFGTFYTSLLNAHAPYMQQWNLTIQKQLGSDWMVSASYLGNNSVHVYTTADQNPALLVPGASTSNTNQRRLLSLLDPSQGKYYGTIFGLDDGGTQHYEGMLLSIQHRLTAGFTAQANYTLSHCIGVPQNYETTGNTYVESDNRRASVGNCNNVDRRHILNISTVAETPKLSSRGLVRAATGGWKLSTVITAQTGTYYTVLTGTDNALNGQTGQDGQRPNLVLASQYASPKTSHQWLNPAAFQAPAFGTFGNLGNDSVVAPGRLQVDATLARVFSIGEQRAFELRGEAFNILNRTNFGAPNLTLNRGDFGTITTAGDPRIIQLALKYRF